MYEINRTVKLDELRQKYNFTAPQSFVYGEKYPDLLKEFGLKKGELDLLSGGYPCQSFSYAGKKNRTR